MVRRTFRPVVRSRDRVDLPRRRAGIVIRRIADGDVDVVLTREVALIAELQRQDGNEPGAGLLVVVTARIGQLRAAHEQVGVTEECVQRLLLERRSCRVVHRDHVVDGLEHAASGPDARLRAHAHALVGRLEIEPVERALIPHAQAFEAVTWHCIGCRRHRGRVDHRSRDPVVLLALPMLLDSLRSALSSIRLSGAIRFASDMVGPAAALDRDAPATLTTVAAATTANEITSAVLERRFKCISVFSPFPRQLLRSVRVGDPPRALDRRSNLAAKKPICAAEPMRHERAAASTA